MMEKERVAKHIEYHDNGNEFITTQIVGKLKHGVVVYRFPSGRIYMTIPYVKGRRHGKHKAWFSYPKKARYSIQYSFGKKDGISKYWEENSNFCHELSVYRKDNQQVHLDFSSRLSLKGLPTSTVLLSKPQWKVLCDKPFVRRPRSIIMR